MQWARGSFALKCSAAVRPRVINSKFDPVTHQRRADIAKMAHGNTRYSPTNLLLYWDSRLVRLLLREVHLYMLKTCVGPETFFIIWFGKTYNFLC